MKRMAIMGAVIGVLLIASRARAQEVRPESWEYEVAKIVSYVQWRTPRGNTANVGIYLASERCPEGAVALNFEVWPELYLDEYTEVCENGLVDLTGGVDAVDVLEHIFVLRLRYGFNTDDANWLILNMSKDQFWTQVFAAQNAGIEKMYNRNNYFANLPLVVGR